MFADKKKERSSIGPEQEPRLLQRQRDVLAACQKAAQRLHVFRDSTNITHYLPDHGEIHMTWTMILPPEDSIEPAIETVAQNILKVLAGSCSV